ncbi:MAG: DUF1345 domain-containing protein [Telluria sp.]
MKPRGLLPRVLHTRWHLLAAIAVGVAAGSLAAERLPSLFSSLIGWDVAVYVYLAYMLWQVLRCTPSQVRRVASEQDESAGMIMFALIVATVLSVTAIVSMLGHVSALPEDQRALRYIFTALTICGSWFLVGTLFSFHYAHLYYQHDEHRPFDFPEGAEEPDYWDFLYFAFTIAVAVQTSDVAVRSRHARRLVLGQSVLTFFFNLLILGLSVNIGASLLS